MNIYIDANIFVKFFEMSPDSIEELEMLVAVLDQEGAALWLPEQTKREFWSNREKSINKHLKEFAQHKPLEKAPLLVREHPQFHELSTEARKVEELRDKIVNSIKKQILGEETSADKMIRKLFDKSKSIDTDKERLFNEAFRRAMCHLPPGKGEDVGDRLNWLALLCNLPKDSDLHIVTDDVDYRREGYNDKIHPYLEREWCAKNGGNVTLWVRISQFLTEQFPGAKNASEVEQKILVEQLRESKNFSQTHHIIDLLFRHKDRFISSNIVQLIDVLFENTQVRWIATDADIRVFYDYLLNKYGDMLDRETLERARNIISGGDT